VSSAVYRAGLDNRLMGHGDGVHRLWEVYVLSEPGLTRASTKAGSPEIGSMRPELVGGGAGQSAGLWWLAESLGWLFGLPSR